MYTIFVCTFYFNQVTGHMFTFRLSILCVRYLPEWCPEPGKSLLPGVRHEDWGNPAPWGVHHIRGGCRKYTSTLHVSWLLWLNVNYYGHMRLSLHLCWIIFTYVDSFARMSITLCIITLDICKILSTYMFILKVDNFARKLITLHVSWLLCMYISWFLYTYINYSVH